MPSKFPLKSASLIALAGLAALASSTASAQNFPITDAQKATANQVAQAGVPLSELSPTAPDSYTVKRGDTLWAISGLFLKTPWRWPELWGMNINDIRNPHLIYPGQVLYLDKTGGRARLTTRGPGSDNTVKVTPRVRSESLSASAIPTVNMAVIESFLSEPLIVDEPTFARAPRIVATQENRVLLSRGDRAYARARSAETPDAAPLALVNGKTGSYRVFRNAVPLRDPTTNAIIAYEAQYVGKVSVVSSETTSETTGADGKKVTEIIPASLDVVSAKEEMQVGDRLLPEPEREFTNFVPRAPQSAQSGQVVSVYGNAVRFAAQNQVVAINRGREHGIERGHVLAVLRESSVLTDTTDSSRPQVRLPGERNGLIMVFRTFDKVSYAIVLDIQDGVQVGHRFVNP